MKQKLSGKNLDYIRQGDLVRYLPDGNIEYIGGMTSRLRYEDIGLSWGR